MMRRSRWAGAVILAVLVSGAGACRAQSDAGAAARAADAKPVAGAATTRAVAPRKPHDPRSWEAEIAKFEAADRAKMPAPGGVVFVGSSSIRIWKTAEAFPDVNAINRGFGGSWSCDSTYYADRIVTPYKPRTIVFYAGDNDIAGGQTAEQVAACFEAFVEKVRAALPDVKIAFITIKPSIARWKLWPEMQRANAMVKAFAAREKGVEFVDISQEMLGADGRPRKELLRADGLHMTDAGYAIWNQKVKGIVEGK